MALSTTTHRRIVQRTRGHRHGPITRLMSPGDLGQMLKPFVFLDLFNVNNSSAILSTSNQTGATYGSVLTTVNPRIARLGVRWTF